MKIPWWKNALSYLFEFHIESSPGYINPHLYVSLKRGRFQLCTDRAIYSFEDLYVNFSRAFRKIDFDRYPVENILILGYGLGSIPIILEKMFDVNYSFVCVEVDSNVIDLATRYALPKIQSPVEIIEADAMTYLQTIREPFDLVIMDIFLNDEVPEKFTSDEFLEVVVNVFHQDTIFLFNRLADKAVDIVKTGAYYEKIFKKQFANGGYIDVKGNWILINDTKFVKKK